MVWVQPSTNHLNLRVGYNSGCNLLLYFKFAGYCVKPNKYFDVSLTYIRYVPFSNLSSHVDYVDQSILGVQVGLPLHYRFVYALND
jgi:hypothetical protein